MTARSETVLLVTHVVPFPPAAGNEIRILKLISWLRDRGFRVVLLLTSRALPPDVRAGLEARVDHLALLPPLAQPAPGPPRQQPRKENPLLAALAWRVDRLRQRLARPKRPATTPDRHPHAPGLEQSEAERVKRSLCPPALVRAVKALCDEHKPSVVIAEYIFLSECLDVAPSGTLKLIDTHDMFSLKQESLLMHGIADPLACTAEEERACLLKADVVIAIQAREAALMAALVPERSVINVGIDFDVVAHPGTAATAGRMLVVGSDNPPNVHGLRTFLAEAWPAIRRQCPSATLRVVGRLASAVDGAAAGVEPAGWVDSLAAEYAAAEVVINPTIAGTGLKIKTVEALCHGRALVVWPNGADGLAEAEPAPFRIAESWPDFAAAVVSLLNDSVARSRLERLALAYAQQKFNPEAVYAPLAAILAQRSVPVPPRPASSGQDL